MFFSVKTMLRVFLFCSVLSSAVIIEAQEIQSQMSKRFEIVRTASEIIIDGQMDEIAWESAPVIDDFNGSISFSTNHRTDFVPSAV